MTTLVLEAEPVVKSISVSNDTLTVSLDDGRQLTIPLSWYPRLQHGSEQERESWKILGGGYAVEWPTLDEHIGIEGLLAGRRSGENQTSFEKWLASRK
jgi:hypothetical protein